jgi:hypothetical protein
MKYSTRHGMLRITVALIVVTLTGLPVLPAICVNACGEHKTATTHCHDEAVENGAPIITAAGAACSALFIATLFVREDARPVLHTVHTLSSTRTAAALIYAAHAFVAHPRDMPATEARRSLVLRV